MVVRNFRHKGLEKFYTDNNPKGVPHAAAEKLRRMLTFLENMANASELHGIPDWKAHLLRGDRKGTWSLFVTRNWRLTFRIEADEIRDLNLEDYH
ncbi:MAG TPA: type II toxin-antitoxin system RelE/ParE family toxin [Candidatus Acidoferrales bacterium]|nr:type II toxin-antitoxin system RelE/ParE family toxin [Candidatus Acidoferrales bacterium]